MSLTYLKYQNRRNVIIYIIIAIVSGIIISFQNCQTQARQETILRENAEIKHRLDVRDAYQKTELIKGIKERETELAEQKRHNEMFLEHCKQNPCNLPPNLAVLPAQRNFKSIEEILLKEKE